MNCGRDHMCRRGILLFSLISVLWVSGAEASCSGSGTTWTCPAGTTSADLRTALSSAADGATLTFAAGSYNSSSLASFDNAKGATLICVPAGSCNVTASVNVLGMNNLSGINNKFYRISGFNFNFAGGPAGNYLIWFYGQGGTAQQIRIDHNNFIATVPGNNIFILFGDVDFPYYFFGVIDHNTFSSPGDLTAFMALSALKPSPPPSPAGTANNLFFEDNTITVTTMSNFGGIGCMDGWGGDAIVYRHNTSTNCLVATHGATHSGGPANIELYENDIRVDSGADPNFQDCYRCFHHQGSGEFIAFNNRFAAFSGKNGDPMGMMDYRAYANSIDGGAPICDGTYTAAFGDGGHDGNRLPITTYQGYPCWHQPGRDFVGNLKPMYIWNNVWSDTLAQISMTMENLGGTPDYTVQHELNNRDYFNAVSASAQTSPTSPFNGTSGMGF